MTHRVSRRRVLGYAGAATVAASAMYSPLPMLAKQGSAAEIEFAITQSFSDAAHPMMQIVDAFNALDTGVQVTATSYGASYEDIMQRAQANISANIGPAIIVTGWKYALFADAALGIVDLREVGGDETDTIISRYKPWVADIIRVDDKLAGLPMAVSTPILYCNKDLFAQAGIAEDVSLASWDDVALVAAQLTESTDIEAAIVGGMNEWTAQSFIQNSGGFVLNAEFQPVLDSPEAVAGMQAWEQLRLDGHYVALPNDQQAPLFLAGSAAMNFTSVAGLSNIRVNAGFEVGTAEFPANGTHAKSLPSGGNFLGVYTQDAEQQAAAWEFLKFVNSEEGATLWNQTGYMVATTDDIPVLAGAEPAYAQADIGLTNETIWPGARGLEALIVFVDWVTRMVTGDVTVEQGMPETQSAIAELLA